MVRPWRAVTPCFRLCESRAAATPRFCRARSMSCRLLFSEVRVPRLDPAPRRKRGAGFKTRGRGMRLPLVAVCAGRYRAVWRSHFLLGLVRATHHGRIRGRRPFCWAIILSRCLMISVSRSSSNMGAGIFTWIASMGECPVTAKM